MLTDENHTYTTHEEISELLASTYTKLSDNSNYDPHFIPTKLAQESIPIDFSLSSPHASPQDYNLPITQEEIYFAINKASKKSATQDMIIFFQYSSKKSIPTQ